MKKILLVTGGSRGIGAATCIEAAKLGYTVCFTYRSNQHAACEVADQVRLLGADVYTYPLDVADKSEVEGLFTQIDKNVGSVTHLVNNAGVLEVGERFDNYSTERIERVFAVNVYGLMHVSAQAIKRMSQHYGGSGGAIVNVSSAASRIGGPKEFVDYAATKGAVDSLTIGLAKELAEEGVRVNAVRPGLIDTDIHASGGDSERPERLRNSVPMQRIGTAMEVANAVHWLLSDEASFVTGSILDVSGGR